MQFKHGDGVRATKLALAEQSRFYTYISEPQTVEVFLQTGGWNGEPIIILKGRGGEYWPARYWELIGPRLKKNLPDWF
jgi:hypothetical protein